MSSPSQWPLAPESSRFVIPRRTISQLAAHPLSKGLYPLGIGYYQRASGHHMARQEHDDNLLIYCLEGRGRLTVGEERHTVRAGDLMLIPRGIAHAYQSGKADPWTIFWVHFDGEDAADFIAHLQSSRSGQAGPVSRLGIHSRLVSDFSALLESRQASYNLNAYINAANQLRQILSHIALLQPLARQQQSADSFDLEAIHSLMQSRLHEQLDLDTLAETVNLSKYHFVKRYKELTGTTPINHFIHLKIEKACHLLDVTQKNINEIAFAVGYEDAYYFSRIFKKTMGLSPSQYRQMRVGGVPYGR
ncbi:AraC family transcriptional regulator [Marinobacterium arenosum]|uniref:AraC family transcriptional regulator n=1 Tax=Marinobacterium arenosum TaxID=2862496 RepID=UPI001C97A199|nr:AraC family ligand binding domain-containing protein [Marinobacterium arenosum]MBY4675055.1 AraC family ligand binding domain-containing protein [Marinobacterium arenosum]